MKKKKGGRWTIIFLCCTLAVPTVAILMGAYTGPYTLEALTLGMFGMVIDVGLIYACDWLVDGFAVPGLLYAVLTAILINTVCAVAAHK